MIWHTDAKPNDNVFVAVETAGYYASANPAPRTLDGLHAAAKTFAATYPFPQSEVTNPADTWIMAEIVPIVVRSTGDAERLAVEVGSPTAYFAFNAASALEWETPHRGGARAYDSHPTG